MTARVAPGVLPLPARQTLWRGLWRDWLLAPESHDATPGQEKAAGQEAPAREACPRPGIRQVGG